MLNVELAIKVRDQIADHPETHNQKWWMQRIPQAAGDYCQTTACAAGWTVLLGDPAATPVFRGYESSSLLMPDGTGRGYSEYAAELLGIGWGLGHYLFDQNRTGDEVLDVLNAIIDGREFVIPDGLDEDFDDEEDDEEDDEDTYPEVDADWGIPEIERQEAMD